MDKNIQEIEKKAIRAIKISVAAIAISLFLGILSLWVLLNQVTISVGIDKKLIKIEKQIQNMESKAESKAESK